MKRTNFFILKEFDMLNKDNTVEVRPTRGNIFKVSFDEEVKI